VALENVKGNNLGAFAFFVLTKINDIHSFKKVH